MIRRPPRSTQSRSSAASDVYKRQAYSRRADEEDVGRLGHEAQGGQLVDQGPIDRGLGLEVEVLEAPGGGEARKAQAAGQPTGLGGLHLDRQQALAEGRR